MSDRIVTRKSLQDMLNHTNRNYVMAVIGRALTVLYNNQTADEQSTNHTQVHNSIGFTGSDARSGTLTAKYYIKHKRLEDWQMQAWLRKGTNGFSRLCKYHNQLNDAAVKSGGAK